MCGIIGYVGKGNAIKKIITSLKQLEYRGYDSAGISYLYNNEIKTVKEIGKIVNLEKKLDYNEESHLGIGHTRWATHGKPSVQNSHPHTKGDVTIVHNGIIENYSSLKEGMIKEGYTFYSDTDTEIACAVIDYYLKKTGNIITALREVQKKLKGSYALGIIIKGDDNNLYAMRKDSPLIIGVSDNENFIASDVPAILKYTDKYILLNNGEIAKLDRNNVYVYGDGFIVDKQINIFEKEENSIDKMGYDHYMLKEIHEQPLRIRNIIDKYIVKEEIDNLPDLSKYKDIHIVACGSAYHSALVCKYLIEEYGNIRVLCEIASEYRYKKEFISKDTLLIVISQSGETADTLACVKLAKGKGASTLGIINVKGSSISREVDNVIYIEAGVEIAVATTKAYTLQVIILSLLAVKLGIKNKLLDKDKIYEEYKSLSNIIEKEVNRDYLSIAKKLYKHNDIYFLGRNIDYASSMEASLKLKEISYIHCETYPAGELKHGSIALIENGTPVISLLTKDIIREKTISNIKEVKARGAYNIIISNEEIDNKNDFCDEVIYIPRVSDLITPVISIVPMQLLAYDVALLKGCDIDKPRNLAKSVTVE